MASIHAYVEQRRPPLRDLLRNVKPIPPADAARIIAAGEGPLVPLQRQLAAVRLVAHARHEDQAIRAVDLLLGSAELTRNLLAWLDANPRRAVRGAAHENDPEEQVAEGLQAVLRVPPGPGVFATPGSCTSWSAWSNVDRPENSNDVSISVVANAGQTFTVARQKLDPQSWGGCSTFWAKTYLVEVKAGQVEFEAGKPKVKTTPPPLGAPYTNETLYEDVRCDGHCSLEMLLDVSASLPAGDTYLVQYGKPNQLSGKPTIVGDDGHVKATSSGATLTLRSVKRIGFTENADAALLYWLLQQIDVTAHLERVACCT